MSDLQRSPSRTPRRAREKRAYQLVLATGGLSAVAVVGFVLAVIGVIGLGIPLLAGALAIVCGLLFRRAVGS